MNWYKKAVSQFDFEKEKKKTWNDIVKEAKDVFNIYFDLENNEPKGDSKYIKTDVKTWNDENYGILAQAVIAGGDWENSIVYFRCQLFTSKVGESNSKIKFIYIPSFAEGNVNLVKSDEKPGKWIASSNDNNWQKNDIEKCFKSLKEIAPKIAKGVEDGFGHESMPGYNLKDFWKLIRELKK